MPGRWDDNIKMNLMETECDVVDGTGSISCPVAGLDISCVKNLDSAGTVLVY
jgi:hypothetical protein